MSFIRLKESTSFLRRTVECLLHEKSTKPTVTIFGPQNDKGIREVTTKIEEHSKRFELKEEDVNKLYQNVMKAVVELEKVKVFGPLSNFIRKENLREEFKKLPKMLEKPDDNLREIANMFFRMSDILLIEKHPDCVQKKITGLKYFEKLYKDDPKAMFPVYLEMGKFFQKINIQQAEPFYLKAMSLIEKIEPAVRDEYLFKVHLKGLAQVYGQVGDIEKALNSLKKTVELIDTSLKDKVSPQEKAMIYYETGNCLIQMKQEKTVLTLWIKAEKMLEEAGDKKMAGKMCQDIGRFCETTNDFDGAKNAYTRSIELCKEAYGEEHNLTKTSKEKLKELIKKKKYFFFSSKLAF